MWMNGGDRFHRIIEGYFFGMMKDVFLFKMINADHRIFADLKSR